MIKNKNILVIIFGTMTICLSIFSISLYSRVSYLEDRFHNERIVKKDKNGRIMDPYVEKEVKNTIIKNRKPLLACYQEYLKNADNNKRNGQVKLDWHIDRKGGVVSPEIIFSQVGNDAFKECLKGVVSRWQFPEPPVNRKKYIEHTFNFSDKVK